MQPFNYTIGELDIEQTTTNVRFPGPDNKAAATF